MDATAYFEVLKQDARRWPDMLDYYQHGPTRCPCTVPPVLRIGGAVARNMRLFRLPWVPAAWATPRSDGPRTLEWWS